METIIDTYSEAEIQAFIVLIELIDPIETPNNNFYTFFPETPAEAQTYFRRFALDLPSTIETLVAKGLARNLQDIWILTPTGRKIATEIRRLRPPIWYWYREFYSAIEHSRAFSNYCHRVFGQDLGQHGFSNMAQLQWMLERVKLDETSRLLDIGCGNGKIPEYISDLTGARVTGIDYIPEAIHQAVRRTEPKRGRLHFKVDHLDTLAFAAESFDLILSIDSIFFGRDLSTTLARLKTFLRPGGQMAIFCSDNLAPALKKNDMAYEIYDFSREHYEHLQRKHQVALELREAFEQEGSSFIWENLITESTASTAPFDPDGKFMPRYFYHVRKID